MLKYLLVIMLMMFSSTAHAYECNEDIDIIAFQNKVRIICKTSSLEKMPDSINLEQANQNMVNLSTEALKQFFESYNKDFIKDKIKNIYIFKNITYLETQVDGLSDGENIWLNLDNYSASRITKVYVTTLHHEFSSNIYKSTSLVKRFIWKKISSSYYSTIAFLKKCLNNYEFCQTSTKEMLNDGFLKMYAMTNDENDFNVYAQMLFTEPQKLKQLESDYPMVHKKLEKLKEFYRDLGFKGKFPDET